MMTVLNTMDIMDINPWVYYLIGICIVVGVLAVVSTAFASIWSPVPNVLLIVAGICLVVALVGIAVFPEVPTGKFMIEASFTDDFPFNSVMKEYEVIEQRGDIFVLEPKERKVD